MTPWFFNSPDDLNAKRSEVMHKHDYKTETSAHAASAKSPSESKLGVTSGANEQVQKGKTKSQAVVRLRAYQKWEAAGKPKGMGSTFG
jgi:hypothetical protein